MDSKRGTFLLAVFLFLAMLIIPMAAFGSGGKVPPSAPSKKAAPKSTPPPSGAYFRMKDSSTGKTITAGDKDFVRGAVAAEMSPEAPQEALKAQAVAAYTYYSRLRQQNASHASSPDFTVSTADWNIYVPQEEMKKRWGNSYGKYYSAISGAADAVSGQAMTCGGKLIDATYFAISSGQTEDAADVWGSPCAYLVSVASPWDVYAGGYQTSASFSESDFRGRILKIAPKADLGGPAENWVGAIVRSPAGSVKAVTVGGKVLTGSNMRQAFGLRSADFTVTHTGSGFDFTVKGYGHGVGMSQTGAEEMARQGVGYKEILAWYYPNTVLTQAKA